VISYNARHFDIYMIIEGAKGFILVNPIGRIVAKLDSTWKYLRNIFSFKHYAMLWALARLHPRESAKRPLHRKHKDVQKPRRKGFSVFIQLR
jgi:hypothetical protein